MESRTIENLCRTYENDKMVSIISNGIPNRDRSRNPCQMVCKSVTIPQKQNPQAAAQTVCG